LQDHIDHRENEIEHREGNSASNSLPPLNTDRLLVVVDARADLAVVMDESAQ
jgi:hypothetical protein